jgi:hypothetical protein
MKSTSRYNSFIELESQFVVSKSNLQPAKLKELILIHIETIDNLRDFFHYKRSNHGDGRASRIGRSWWVPSLKLNGLSVLNTASLALLLNGKPV